MAQLAARTIAKPGAAEEPISAAAGARAILALSALAWCALAGAALALF
jgi:hypothetical protein